MTGPAPMINYSFWLRFDASGRAPHVSKNPPGIGMGERAMQVKMQIPKSVFSQPQLIAKIAVEHEQTETVEIDVEAAETALVDALGCTVVVDVVHPDLDTPA